MRCTWLGYSRASCLRVRNRARISREAFSGTKLGRTSPCAGRAASHTAAARFVCARHGLQVAGIGQDQRDVAVGQDVPDRLPVHPRRLHGDVGAAVLPHQLDSARSAGVGCRTGAPRSRACRHRPTEPRPQPRTTRVKSFHDRFPGRAADAGHLNQGTLNSALRRSHGPLTQSGVLRVPRVRLTHGPVRTMGKPTSPLIVPHTMLHVSSTAGRPCR